jgi:aspartate racemase
LVHEAIFNRVYGIKAQSNPVSDEARKRVHRAVAHVRDAGAEAVILGCTELPLAIGADEFDDVALIDPMVALARALIRETYPDRLREFAS